MLRVAPPGLECISCHFPGFTYPSGVAFALGYHVSTLRVWVASIRIKNPKVEAEGRERGFPLNNPFLYRPSQ